MNLIEIIGNLTTDPEVGTSTSGVPFTRFTVAVNRRFKDSSGQRKADYFKCIAFKQMADNCGQYLHKGSKVCIYGEMQQNQYTDRNGEQRTDYVIQVQGADFLASPTPNSTSEQTAMDFAPRKKVVPGQMSRADDEELPF